jgi:hypothetical protein
MCVHILEQIKRVCGMDHGSRYGSALGFRQRQQEEQNGCQMSNRRQKSLICYEIIKYYRHISHPVK